ncbi:LacI family DNA-binding transcriptional regulator [Snuella lapsa]|uniref:LacI family DNA-binding transcriptional regulator n=1 Tax=Snuella lapsa TaxID=870481 RepID=A0ABP6XXI7_9FLAO
MDKKITIYDLAKVLNVSPATISRALNDHPSISFSTKKRIVSYAQSSGYRINKFAANLSKQKSNTIGVIVPKLNSPFMSAALSGIEKIANEHNYNLIISQSLESEQKEKLNAKTLYDSGVDALMVSLAHETANYEHFDIFREQKIPLLFFDRVDYLPNCPTILIDNKQAGFDATEHLILQGCKNILHVSGYLKRNVYSDRFNGFKDALHKHKIEFNPYNLFETDLDPQKIDFVMDHIKNAKESFDGIFFANDAMAVACIQTLLKEGVRIPEDIKIIGFNNNPVSEIIQPNLSTVNYPGYELGVLAGQSIISHLKGNINIQSAESILLKHKLIVRTSSLKNNVK